MDMVSKYLCCLGLAIQPVYWHYTSLTHCNLVSTCLCVCHTLNKWTLASIYNITYFTRLSKFEWCIVYTIYIRCDWTKGWQRNHKRRGATTNFNIHLNNFLEEQQKKTLNMIKLSCKRGDDGGGGVHSAFATIIIIKSCAQWINGQNITTPKYSVEYSVCACVQLWCD